MKERTTEITIYFAPHELAKVRCTTLRSIFDKIHSGELKAIYTSEGIRIPITYIIPL